MIDEIMKNKIQIMSSIQKNPKLAKQFRDALSAPIGSTKREHVKSTLSIMKKVGGRNSDGQGGPLQDVGNFISSGWNSLFGGGKTSSPTPSKPTTPNYANMLVFPAAPKLKSSTEIPPLVRNPSYQTSTPNYSIVDNALKPGGQSTNYSYPTVTPKYTPPVVTPKAQPVDYAAEARKNPVYPGLKQIFSPTNLNEGSKKVLQTIGGTLKPIGAVATAIPGAVGTVGLGALSLLESAVSSAPKLFTGFNNPSELTSPSETLSWKGANWLATESPWMKYLAGTDKPQTTPTTTPVTAPTVKPTTPTTQTTAPVTPQQTTPITQAGSKTTGNYNIAATSIAKMLGTTPDAPLSQIPVLNLAGMIANNEGYFNGTSKVAIKNNNPGNLKFANQPGATQDERGFAVFSTPDEGAQALINDITAKYESGKYSTINDLMSVYSPDSDNPANPSYGKGTDTGGVLSYSPTTGEPIYGSSNLQSSAQSAVNQGTGPGLFAIGVANQKFGGSLDQYIANLDDKLKKDFNLEPLEQELSNLKAEKSNLIPTLQSYITGKDQYLRFIDQKLEDLHGELLTTNMADPFAANQYRRQEAYLMTLKGRQEQRYGNFLNSAISDYNADLEKTQDNYNTVYQHYTDALTRQGTIAQNEYNTLYTTMADLYTNLEQAPIKRENLITLQLQNEANRIAQLKNGIESGVDFNWENVKKYMDVVADKDGNIDFTKMPADGLIGFYKLNVGAQGTEAELTEAIRRALNKTLETSTDPATIAKVKGLINKLASDSDPAGEIFASKINDSVSQTTSKLLSTYILGKMGTVKNAVKSLVGSSGGFLGIGSNKPGIQDKETWIKNNSGQLDKDFLESLYNAINVNVGKGTAYENNPSEIVNRIFSGTDQENADNLANIISISS